jgi:hypothetical protein
VNIDSEKIIDQIHISALAYGTEKIAEKINVPYIRLLNDLREIQEPGLSLRAALQIMETCINDGPDQARQAAIKATKGISQLLEMHK